MAERKHDSEFIKEFVTQIKDNLELAKVFPKIVGGSKEDGLFVRAINKKQVDEYIHLLIENVDLLKNIAKEYNIENSSIFKTIENESNIVKKVCAELGITQAELGRQLDVPASTVGTWASGKIPKMAEVALELMIENKRKDEILKAIKKAQEMIARI
jgi:predicted transcriptional regulator